MNHFSQAQGAGQFFVVKAQFPVAHHRVCYLPFRGHTGKGPKHKINSLISVLSGKPRYRENPKLAALVRIAYIALHRDINSVRQDGELVKR